MAGRKRTPAAIKKLRGNAGRRPLDAEPLIDSSVPECPATLDKDGQNEWIRLTSLMADAGMMSPVYLALLTSYCHTWSDYVKLSQQVEGQDRWMVSDKGYPYENPIHVRLHKTLEALDKKCEKLGITPVTLSKAKLIGKPPSKPTKEQSLAEKLFKVA